MRPAPRPPARTKTTGRDQVCTHGWVGHHHSLVKLLRPSAVALEAITSSSSMRAAVLFAVALAILVLYCWWFTITACLPGLTACVRRLLAKMRSAASHHRGFYDRLFAVNLAESCRATRHIRTHVKRRVLMQSQPMAGGKKNSDSAPEPWPTVA